MNDSEEKIIEGVKFFIPPGYVAMKDIKPTTDSLTTIWMNRRAYQKYNAIRDMYPDVYPPLELEVRIMKNIYRRIHEYWIQLQDASLDRALRYLRSFELYNTMKILNLLMTERKLIPGKDYEIAVETQTEEEQEMYAAVPIDEILREIGHEYAAAGYVWRYFMFYNANSSFVQANLGNVELKPDIFEAFAKSPIDKYDKNVKILRDDYYIGYDDKPKAPFVGWRKKDLFDAIKKSGLWKEDTVVRISSKGVETKGEGIPTKDLKIKQRGYRTTVRALAKYPSENMTYYETLYRLIFNTLTYVNWGKICGMKLVNLTELRRIGSREFGIPLSSKFDYGRLCTEIGKAAELRRGLPKQIATLLPFQSQIVKFQPTGAPWLDTLTRYEFTEGEALVKPYAQFVAVSSWCQDETVDKTELLNRLRIKKMSYMLPQNLEPYSKDEICAHLIEEIQVQAEKYEYIFFDCSDPAIEKRHILNTLAIMELGGVLKDVDIANVTKEELCGIVNNYISLLQETKALTIAPGMRVSPKFDEPI